MLPEEAGVPVQSGEGAIDEAGGAGAGEDGVGGGFKCETAVH